MPDEWVYPGHREVIDCPAAESHPPHLWSPTLGNPCDEDQTSPDIRACHGGHPAYDPDQTFTIT